MTDANLDQARFTPTDEWTSEKLLGVRAAIGRGDWAAAQSLLSRVQKPPPPPILWGRRWWWPLAAIAGAVILAIVCLIVAASGPPSENWPAIVAGAGVGVLASALVAAVMFLVELKRERIHAIVSTNALRTDLTIVVQALTDRFAEVNQNLQTIREELLGRLDDLEETRGVSGS
jgi:ABC-type Fe3+-siderophore transport system permease subunit